MPQEIDSQYDALVETYADVVADRLAEDPKALYEFCRETLIDYYENMTEHELIEHIVEMEDDDEIVTCIYGNYPVDRDQEIEGRDYHSTHSRRVRAFRSQFIRNEAAGFFCFILLRFHGVGKRVNPFFV